MKFLISLGVILTSLQSSLSKDIFQNNSNINQLCNQYLSTMNLMLNPRSLLVLENTFGMHNLKDDRRLFDLFNLLDSIAVGKNTNIKREDYQFSFKNSSELRVISVTGSSEYKRILDIISLESYSLPLPQGSNQSTLIRFNSKDDNSNNFLWGLNIKAAMSSNNFFLKNIATQFPDYFLQGYLSRLTKIKPSDLKILKDISTKKNIQDRLFLIAITENGPLGEKLSIPSQASIRGVISAVVSYNKDEKLPLEVLNNLTIDRRENLKIAEIGRYFVSRDGSKDVSADMIAYIAHYISSFDLNLDKVYVQADLIHYRLFKKFGFEVEIKFAGIQGDEFILSTSPLNLKNKTYEILGKWNNLPKEEVEQFKNKWF